MTPVVIKNEIVPLLSQPRKEPAGTFNGFQARERRDDEESEEESTDDEDGPVKV